MVWAVCDISVREHTTSPATLQYGYRVAGLTDRRIPRLGGSSDLLVCVLGGTRIIRALAGVLIVGEGWHDGGKRWSEIPGRNRR